MSVSMACVGSPAPFATSTVAVHIAVHPQLLVRRDITGQLLEVIDNEGYVAGSEPEVAAVFEVPLADLDVDPVFETIPESDGPVIKLPLMDGFVHAPTAAVVHQFVRIACRGELRRVAHYEQPVFAWR